MIETFWATTSDSIGNEAAPLRCAYVYPIWGSDENQTFYVCEYLNGDGFWRSIITDPQQGHTCRDAWRWRNALIDCADGTERDALAARIVAEEF